MEYSHNCGRPPYSLIFFFIWLHQMAFIVHIQVNIQHFTVLNELSLYIMDTESFIATDKLNIWCYPFQKERLCSIDHMRAGAH